MSGFRWLLSIGGSFASLAAAQGTVRVVDDGQPLYGGSWALAVASDGTIASQLEISDLSGGFGGRLRDEDHFGSSISALGDLDGNGTVDLAVGAPGADRGGRDRGALWILFRDASGAVESAHALSSSENGLGALADREWFGDSVATLGDLNGDGVVDLAVGAPGQGSTTEGSVRVLFLASDGTVSSEVLIGAASGGFGGSLELNDGFGSSLAALGDLDGDGVTELAVGAPADDTLWILYLNADGSVKAELEIAPSVGGFAGPAGEGLGSSVAPVGDLDEDGNLDLVVGASDCDDGANNRGAVWILFLDSDETVRAQQKISATQGGLGSFFNRRFGSSAAPLGDWNGDGTPDVAVGAPGQGSGALYLVMLAADGTVVTRQTISSNVVGLHDGDAFGAAVHVLGDLDFDGNADLVVGSNWRDGAPLYAGYREIQPAIDAAQDGDVLLVKAGSYGPIVVANKGLTIHAEAHSTVSVPTIWVRDLAAQQSVRLRGLTADTALPSSWSNAPRPCSLTDAVGLIWMEDCSSFTSGEDEPGVMVDDCSNAVLLGTHAEATSLWDSGEFACCSPDGMLVLGASNAHVYDGEFLGGAAGEWNCPGPPSCAQSPGVGIEVGSGATLFASGGSATGGPGGLAYPFPFESDCTNGGAGLNSLGASVVRDMHLEGGSGRSDWSGSPCSFQGPPSVGNVTTVAQPAMHFTAESPVREDELITLSFDGPPNVPVYLSWSTQPLAQYRPANAGTGLVGLPRHLVFIGSTDSNGHLSRDVGPLNAAEVRTLFLQAVYQQGGLWLGSGSMLVILDQSF